jgi:uncharacterized protein (TIGR03435 family)
MLACTAGLAFALCPMLPAQTIGGTWQGTLSVPDNPRIAIKLVNGDDGTLHGVLYQLDKGPSAIALTSITFAPPDVTLEQVNAGISFHGKLSADGKSLDGIYSQDKTAAVNQDKRSYPLTLALATPQTLWKRNGPTPLPSMSPTADPAFEVATIKPSPPDAKGYSYKWRTRDFSATNRSVRDLIEFAYQVRDRQISGGPSWFNDTKFDIAGMPDSEGLPSLDQYRLMIEKLLANRFHLQLHTVQQAFPVYTLTRDDKAPRLPHSDPEFDTGAIYTNETADGQTTAHIVGDSMPMFADLLMGFIQDRQIVDETGLTATSNSPSTSRPASFTADPLALKTTAPTPSASPSSR